MPRFNAAKSWKKLDDDLSGKFNYLCDLLDEGYSSVAIINNHEIAIDINPKDGIKIVNDGISIFSLDPLTGEIVIGKYDGLISDLGDLAYDDLVELAKLGSTIIQGGYIKTELLDATAINTQIIQIGSGTTYASGYDPTKLIAGGSNLLDDSERDRGGTARHYLLGVRDILAPYIGQEITISFDMKCPNKDEIRFYAHQNSGISISHSAGQVSFTVSETNKWERFSLKTKVHDWGDQPGMSTGQVIWYNHTADRAVTVRRIDIRLGTVAPGDWSPDNVHQNRSYKGVMINANDGFVSTATIGGKAATVKLNSVDGLGFYDGSTYRGGLVVRGGELALLTDIMGKSDAPYHFLKFTTYNPFVANPNERRTRLEFFDSIFGSTTSYKAAQIETSGWATGGGFHIKTAQEDGSVSVEVGSSGSSLTPNLTILKEVSRQESLFYLQASASLVNNRRTGITGFSIDSGSSGGYLDFEVHGSTVAMFMKDELWFQKLPYYYDSSYNKHAIWHGANATGGSNANGRWIKLPDGTQICWVKKTMGSTDIKTAAGNVYRTAAISIGDTPQLFYYSPISEITLRNVQGYYGVWLAAAPSTATTGAFGNYTLMAADSVTVSSYEIHVVAIGRWKA